MTTPAVEIYTRTEDTATVDGHLVQRGHYETIYDAALAQVVTRAQELGRPVLAKATDGVSTGQTFWLMVASDGTVEPAEPPAAAPGSAPAPSRRRRRVVSPEVNEADFYPDTSPAPSTAPAFTDEPPQTGPPAPTEPVEQVPTFTQPAPGASPSQPPRPMMKIHQHPEDITGPQAGTTGITALPFRETAAQPQPLHTDPQNEVTATYPTPPPPARETNQGHDQGQPMAMAPVPSPTGPSAPPSHGPVNSQPPWPPPPLPVPSPEPSVADLRASRPDAPEAPAKTGWRGGLNRATAGLLKLTPGADELRLRRARSTIQRSLRGPRTVVVINTKGGGGKTTAVYSLAATFGQARGGYVLGWDNNETRGTLAWRAAPARHTNTAVDLLRDLERFEDPRNARVGDLDNYVRSQGSAQFDVLASDENAASAASIDDAAFRALHRSLARFYRILVVDTGNNVKAPNWGAAIDLADQLVVVSSIREDTAGGASWTLDHLIESGHRDKVRNAVTILSAPKAAADPDQRAMHARFRQHFASRTRVVLDVPFDPALVDGDSIAYDALSPTTRQAWLIAAAEIAEGL